MAKTRNGGCLVYVKRQVLNCLLFSWQPLLSSSLRSLVIPKVQDRPHFQYALGALLVRSPRQVLSQKLHAA